MPFAQALDDLMQRCPSVRGAAFTDLDGEEVFRRIRAQRPELPVILASGLNVDEQRARLGSPGRVEYLKKPFSIEVLSDLVDKTLE